MDNCGVRPSFCSKDINDLLETIIECTDVGITILFVIVLFVACYFAYYARDGKGWPCCAILLAQAGVTGFWCLFLGLNLLPKFQDHNDLEVIRTEKWITFCSWTCEYLLGVFYVWLWPPSTARSHQKKALLVAVLLVLSSILSIIADILVTTLVTDQGTYIWAIDTANTVSRMVQLFLLWWYRRIFDAPQIALGAAQPLIGATHPVSDIQSMLEVFAGIWWKSMTITLYLGITYAFPSSLQNSDRSSNYSVIGDDIFAIVINLWPSIFVLRGLSRYVRHQIPSVTEGLYKTAWYTFIAIVFILAVVWGNVATCKSNTIAKPGSWIVIARDSAVFINTSMVLLLVTVSRIAISYLYRLLTGTMFTIDIPATLHYRVGYGVIVASLLHSVAHQFNINDVVNLTPDQAKCFSDHGFLLVAEINSSNHPFRVAYGNPSFITGTVAVAVVVIAILQLVLHIEFPTRVTWLSYSMFQTFHKWGGVCVIVLLLFHGDGHAFSGAVRFWWYMIVPLIIYFVCLLYEALFTVVGTLGKHTLIMNSTKTVGIFMKLRLRSKENYPFYHFRRYIDSDYRPCQWIYLASSSVKKLEWHPFTLYRASGGKLYFYIAVPSQKRDQAPPRPDGWVNSMLGNLVLGQSEFSISPGYNVMNVQAEFCDVNDKTAVIYCGGSSISVGIGTALVLLNRAHPPASICFIFSCPCLQLSSFLPVLERQLGNNVRLHIIVSQTNGSFFFSCGNTKAISKDKVIRGALGEFVPTPKGNRSDLLADILVPTPPTVVLEGGGQAVSINAISQGVQPVVAAASVRFDHSLLLQSFVGLDLGSDLVFFLGSPFNLEDVLEINSIFPSATINTEFF
jgi:hypothetical protein